MLTENQFRWGVADAAGCAARPPVASAPISDAPTSAHTTTAENDAKSRRFIGSSPEKCCERSVKVTPAMREMQLAAEQERS